MRSAKESGCFPYKSKLVCFIEVCNDGTTRQLSNRQECCEACSNATKGISVIYAVWPGNCRSDLFVIDELDRFYEAKCSKWLIIY